MIENRLRQFGYLKRRNYDDIVKKIGEIKVERNQERGRPMKKWIGEIIRGRYKGI